MIDCSYDATGYAVTGCMNESKKIDELAERMHPLNRRGAVPAQSPRGRGYFEGPAKIAGTGFEIAWRKSTELL